MILSVTSTRRNSLIDRKQKVFPLIFILCLCLVLMASCMPSRKTLEPNGMQNYTAYEIRQMQRKMDTLAGSVTEIEMKVKANEAALSRMEEEIREMNKVSSSLPSGTQTEVVTPVNKPSQILEHEERNGTLEKSMDFISGQSPEDVYRRARLHLEKNEYESAEKLFSQLARQYPDHNLAVNSLYWMGECHYAMQDYHGAVMIFKKLLKAYPEGTKVPDALLKTAYAYLSLDETEKAHEYLKMVVKQFPFSTAGEQAEEKLKLLQ